MAKKVDVIEVLKEAVADIQAKEFNQELWKVISKVGGVETSALSIPGAGVVLKVGKEVEFLPGVKLLPTGVLVKL